MIYMRTHIFRLATALVLVLCLWGCASYNDAVAPYYRSVSAANYPQAEKELDKNSLLQKPRNQLLYLMEKGRIAHLRGEYQESNKYFNDADQMLDNGLKSVGDEAVGVVLNPMSQKYKGEDFEKFMIHYYKALNYLYLHQTEDAIVEARRITLQAQEQGDKFNNKDTRYSNDAFSLMLQGMLYESNNDINNAFISYRNAADIYLKSPDRVYYGTSMPLGLQQDVIRTARLNGFNDEADRYENTFGIKYQAPPATDGGSLIVFWENGRAPIKEQTNLFFTLVRNSNGDLFFDGGGGVMIPFNYSGDRSKVNTKSIESLHAAFPKYVALKPYYSGADITVNGNTTPLTKAEDINELAFKTLQQRMLSEMGKVLSRLAVKKIAEYSLRESAKQSNGKTNGLLEGLGYGMQLYSLLSEKADTRNWQSLPSYISYARVPLQKGANHITFNMRNANGGSDTKTIDIEGKGGLQFYNFATLR